MFRGAIMAAALLATPISTNGQDDPTVGSGVMASKCSRLVGGMDDTVAVSRNPLAFAMLSWAEGYITATNMALAEKGEPMYDLDSLSAPEIWASLYGYCKRNPDAIAVEAVIQTMVKLERVNQ